MILISSQVWEASTGTDQPLKLCPHPQPSLLKHPSTLQHLRSQGAHYLLTKINFIFKLLRRVEIYVFEVSNHGPSCYAKFLVHTTAQQTFGAASRSLEADIPDPLTVLQLCFVSSSNVS